MIKNRWRHRSIRSYCLSSIIIPTSPSSILNPSRAGRPPPPPLHRYSFHSSSLRTQWFRTRLEDRALLKVVGPDSMRFLQGLMTHNLELLVRKSPQPRSALYTALLTPPGRIRFDGLIYPCLDSTDLSFLIDHHRSQSDPLYLWLNRFILRSRLKILEHPSQLWVVWPNHPPDPDPDPDPHPRPGPGPGPRSDPLLQPTAHIDHPPSILLHSKAAFKDPRGDHRLGYRILGNPSDHPELEPLCQLPQASLSAYTLHVLLHASLPPSLSPPYPVTLPFEANLDHHRAVDFRKGCYVGQELTARTYHTGVIRKRLVPISIASAHRSTVSVIPSSIPTSEDRVRVDDSELETLLGSIEFSLEDNLVRRASEELETKPRKPKPIGRLCGPFIHCDHQDAHLLFGLGLLRIDHEAFGPTSTWPSIDLTINGADQDSHWTIQPIRPHWWPS